MVILYFNISSATIFNVFSNSTQMYGNKWSLVIIFTCYDKLHTIILLVSLRGYSPLRVKHTVGKLLYTNTLSRYSYLLLLLEVDVKWYRLVFGFMKQLSVWDHKWPDNNQSNLFSLTSYIQCLVLLVGAFQEISIYNKNYTKKDSPLFLSRVVKA